MKKSTTTTTITKQATKAQYIRQFGQNCMGQPLAACGFKVRTDKGTFERQFGEDMSLDDARSLVNQLTRGHVVFDEKIFSSHGGGHW